MRTTVWHIVYEVVITLAVVCVVVRAVHPLWLGVAVYVAYCLVDEIVTDRWRARARQSDGDDPG